MMVTSLAANPGQCVLVSDPFKSNRKQVPLIIRALIQYYSYHGDDLQVECPTGSGRMMTLCQVAEEISRRLSHMFVQDDNGHHAVFGGAEKFQHDPHWRECLLFYEYFHGDNGSGLGASHQTGWTGVVARAMHLFATLTP